MARIPDRPATIVQEAWDEAFNNQDMPAFVNHHSEDVVYFDPTFPKPVRGRTELQAVFEGIFKMFPDCKMEIYRLSQLDSFRD
jgi:ketosteroid isomerase-like protein